MNKKQKFNEQKNIAKKKIKASFNNFKQYKIIESKQFIGLMLIIVFSFLFVVSIVQVRVFSTINSYTVGMLFGYYSYFIYIGFIVLGLCMVFQIDIRIEKFIAKKFNKKFYFTWLPYLFFSLGIALIIESILKSTKSQTLFPGSGAFYDFFNDWWQSFTNDFGKIPGSTSWLPNVWNSGVVISLFMSMLVSWSGYIVSIIMGAIFISYFVFYTFYGSIIKRFRMKIFKNSNKKDEINREEFEDYKTKIMDLSFEDNNGMIDKPKLEIVKDIDAKTKNISIENSDDIFPIEKIKQNNEEEINFVEEKTSQINLEKNLTTEFKVDLESYNNSKSKPDIETFDFELDVFNTKTNLLNTDDILLEKKDNSFEFNFDNTEDESKNF